MVWVIRGDTFAPGAGEIAKPLAAVLNEALYTFALALVVLNVACTKATEGNSYYGLAIGFTIATAAAAGGSVSGGAYNPAVGIGPAIVHMLNGGSGFSNIWIYLVGPFGGGVAGAYVYAFQHGES